MMYAIIYKFQSSQYYIITNSIITSKTQSSNSIKHDNWRGDSFTVTTEHKIGYSFLNEKIVTFIGVNFAYDEPFDVTFEHNKGYFNQIPFTSVKINY